tara:strand:- start:187 stop:333 length:147 start_codon:yes stop_codon:yes gene_type:complete
MKKNKINKQSNPEPYEDMLRLEKLDTYEALIKSNMPKTHYQFDELNLS